VVAVTCLAVAACAPKALVLPSGASTPFLEFPAAYQQATAACSGVKTLRASMSMSGKAGPAKLRGRIDAGFAAPGRARLEGIPPFGKPVFILVADGGRGTLVLPREDRVLRDAPPDRIVEALAGVPLGADALRTAISGCGFGVAAPSDGRRFANGWVAASSGEATTYLRPNGATWEVAGATLGGVTVTYADYASGRPATVRIRAGANASTADMTLRLSDVDINTTLDPRTFEVELPGRPIPLTLEELRRAGPLGGS
jgi:outer membrane lipoprotein-sorting protein